MHRCKICLAPVLLRKKRKRLDVLTSSFVRQGIVELACKIGQNSDEAKIEFSEGYVCMSCFRAVGNYAMLKEIEGQLLNKLSASRYVKVDGSVRAKSCVAGTKRSHADASASLFHHGMPSKCHGEDLLIHMARKGAIFLLIFTWNI